MCSVLRCESSRRGAQRFKLPEDAERRLEWVQFVLEVNGQRLEESRWTDISICREHFTGDCFGSTGPTGTAQLKPGAVPSLFFKSEPDQPEPDQPEPDQPEPDQVKVEQDRPESDQVKVEQDRPESDQVKVEQDRPESDQVKVEQDRPEPDQVKVEPGSVVSLQEPVETTDRSPHCERLKTCDSQSVPAEKPILPNNTYYIAVPVNPEPSYSFVVDYRQMVQKVAIPPMKRKYVVNKKRRPPDKKRRLPLCSSKCPSCGSKVKLEKVTQGELVVVNRKCLQCDYRKQLKSQDSASVPAAEGQHPTGGTIEAPSEGDDPMDETGESSDQRDMDSDEDWRPAEDLFPAKLLHTDSDEEAEEEEPIDDSVFAVKHHLLCTDCGKFFSQYWPHTCEHKLKPFSCNICGKRCVSEVSLITHNRVHDVDWVHPCKYCHATFKTKVDKISHEQIHATQEEPYKCPDCSETFATSKERQVHLEDHRGPRQLTCHICGVEFNNSISVRRHLVVHSGLKLFKCSVCDRGFKQASHLKSHMRLHTGERPFKCQHCDKSFNHNVSLKSHVQRYHTSNAVLGRKRGRRKKTVTDTIDSQEKGSMGGAELGIEEGRDKDELVEKERIEMAIKKHSTGRPIGRPKRKNAGPLALAGEMQGSGSNTETSKSRRRKSKTTRCRDEESEDELTEGNISFDSKEEEEEEDEMSRKVKKTTRRGKTKKSDSDTDFSPKGPKKKSYGSQNSGRSSEKRRRRPRKNQVDED